MRIRPGTLFEDAAQRRGQTLVHLDRPFDIAPQGGLTYRIGELAALVREASGWLAAAGVRPGDRVGIVKDNHWDIDVLAYAAVRLGAVPAKIRSNLTPSAIETMLRRLEPSLLVTTARCLESALCDGIDLGGLAKQTLSIDRPVGGSLSIDAVRGQPVPPPEDRGDDDPLVVCPTSGTTGIPKLVVHSTNTIIRRLAQFEAHRYPFFGGRPTDTLASASAFSHGRTFCWTAVALTLTPRNIVIISDQDQAHAEPLLRVYPPDIFEALPSTFARWEATATGPHNPFRNVRLYISTYDAIHPPAVRTFLEASQRKHVVFMHGWGQSETGPLAFRLFTRKSLASKGDRHPTTRNAGSPTPIKTRLRVVDPTTLRRVPCGTPGVILARTKALALTYLGEQDRWDGKVHGAWFNTGDVGTVSRGGVVRLLDREVDAVPGLSCLELEDVIHDRMPDVVECVLLGAPGRFPLPVVVTKDGTLDAERWRVSTADLPQLDEPVVLSDDQVPCTGTGKVRRLELRKELGSTLVTYGKGTWI